MITKCAGRTVLSLVKWEGSQWAISSLILKIGHARAFEKFE